MYIVTRLTILLTSETPERTFLAYLLMLVFICLITVWCHVYLNIVERTKDFVSINDEFIKGIIDFTYVQLYDYLK